MFNAVKIGDVEAVAPDERLVAMVDEILKQNRLILDMNTDLLRALSFPPKWKCSMPDTGKPLS
jgi:hypothetical protein